MCEVILQILSPLCSTSHYKITNTDKKQQESHQVNSKKSQQINIVWSGLTNWKDCMNVLENNILKLKAEVWKLNTTSTNV